MKSVMYFGLDVHKSSFMAAVQDSESRDFISKEKLKPTKKAVLELAEKIHDVYPDHRLVFGYEAGCTGFVLLRELQEAGYECHVMAPSTMAVTPSSGRKKTDRRDAENIARCLANQTYSDVHVPTKEDETTRDLIRMRDDMKESVKRYKHQILAFCLRHKLVFNKTKTNWTKQHLDWLRNVEVDPLERVILDGYLREMDHTQESIAAVDAKIAEIAETERYAEPVHKLMCFKGIRVHTALALVCEIGDFRRFATAGELASFLGLVPSEHSSGNSVCRGSITKSGNGHLRRLVIESAQTFSKGGATYKSAALKARQAGAAPEIIEYADRGSERLRKRFQRMINNGKAHNVAKVAVARELACFIWGMMTGNMTRRCA